MSFLSAPARTLGPSAPARAPAPAGIPAPAHRDRPPLRLVEPDAPTRSRPRLGLVGTVLLGGVFLALFALAAVHTLVVQAQFELDGLERQVATRVDRVEALRVSVARAESPDAIVAAAERLGMVRPPERVYLLPVSAPERADTASSASSAPERPGP